MPSCVSHFASASEPGDGYQLRRSPRDQHRIPKRSSKSLKGNRHHIAILQCHAIAKAEYARSEEMNVYIAGLPVLSIFEVMMLQVFERVAHVRFSRRQFARPDRCPIAL